MQRNPKPFTAGAGVAWRKAGPADVPALAALYAQAARTLGPRAYTPGQVKAWAGFGADTQEFRDYILRAGTWIAAASDAVPLGFCGIDATGEVRSLYVRADVTRQGLGSALLAYATRQAQCSGARHFTAWATVFSRPVFERAGFHVSEICRTVFQGVLFDRIRVQRLAEEAPPLPPGWP